MSGGDDADLSLVLARKRKYNTSMIFIGQKPDKLLEVLDDE